MNSVVARLTLILIFATLTVVAWPRSSYAVDPVLQIMPPVWGGSFYDYGPHYDEGSAGGAQVFGGYDYSQPLGSAI